MYKNLVAAVAAALLLSQALGQTPTNTAAPLAKPAAAVAPAATLVAPVAAPLKVAFVYVTPVTDAGWVRQHDQGRRALEAQLPGRVSTHYVESVAEGADAERVLRDLARQGYGLIIAPSFGYMEAALKVAQEFPQVKFESITGYKRADNVANANARYYEGRYLAGVAAARMMRGNVAGYVAGFAIPEVVQGVNAFMLGLRSVKPQAELRLVWLNTWFDPPRERDAAMTLINQGAEVLAFHTASTAVMVAAQERGKLAIAYHSDMRHLAPQAQILAVTHHWGAYYTERAQAVLQGRWRSADYWGGVREGMVQAGDFGAKVPPALRAEIASKQKAIATGRLVVFAGPLRDNQGRERLGARQVLSDAQILTMDYLLQGVRAQQP